MEFGEALAVGNTGVIMLFSRHQPRKPFMTLTCLAIAIGALSADPIQGTFRKVVLDKVFHSEGVAVGDVNRDGKPDVITGEFWYEAPKWNKRRIRPGKDYGDGLRSYSESFACWADDFNKDGWVDVLVICFPGAPCYWLENPKGKEELWKPHMVWHSACNETPIYADLFGDGKRVLVMGFQPKGKENEGQMGWFEPGANPAEPWTMHPVSVPSVAGKPPVPGTFKFSHGLGVGDLDGDGKNEIICTGGYWKHPATGRGGTEPWEFVGTPLGEACSDMAVVDVDGDGKKDVISSSAHKFGIWWHKQRSPNAFQKNELFPKLISETHALWMGDLDKDGTVDVVTGKRWWSHGRAEPGSEVSPAVYMLKGARGSDGMLKFTPVVLDGESGVGTQFTVADINGDGRLDVITSNKKGVFILFQNIPPG